MQIEHLALDALIPYARNSRTHSDEQVAQIAGSIREFGFTNPVLIDGEGGIIAGHGRVMAARKLGLDNVPCIRLAHLTEAQKRAYIIADNKLALNAGWDENMLSLELQELQALDYDLSLTGFMGDEIDQLLADLDATPEGATDEDETPPVQAEAITKPGDVWLLGKHRIMCGDSTDAGSVALLMKGNNAGLCFTSPPYGNQREYTTGGISDWDNLMQGVFACLPISEGGQVLVNLGLIHRHNEWLPYWDGWIEWMHSNGWRRFGLYVWDQGSGLPGDWSGRLAPSHEFVFHFNKEKSKPNKWIGTTNRGKKTERDKGLRKSDGSISKISAPEKCGGPVKIPDSVIRIYREQSRTEFTRAHPAVYPVALPVFVMNTWPGDCYEPFSGSGTTLVAAEQTGCRCYAMELSPNYVDVAVRRWQQFTGKRAVLEATGEPFPDAAAVNAQK